MCLIFKAHLSMLMNNWYLVVIIVVVMSLVLYFIGNIVTIVFM